MKTYERNKIVRTDNLRKVKVFWMRLFRKPKREILQSHFPKTLSSHNSYLNNNILS